MADITLAEFHGRVWLVGGEPHIDDLLANTLAREISIEIIPCEQKSDVHALWVQHCGPREATNDPWMIHPAIVARIRRSSPDYSVFFAEWSAKLDQDANTVIASVAAWACDNLEAGLELVEFIDTDAPGSIVELSRLRARLIEEKLAAAGIGPGRISHGRRAVGDVAGVAEESQRVDIVVKMPAQPGV